MLNDISPYLGLTVLNAEVCPDCSASITATRSALGIPVLRVNYQRRHDALRAREKAERAAKAAEAQEAKKAAQAAAQAAWAAD